MLKIKHAPPAPEACRRITINYMSFSFHRIHVNKGKLRIITEVVTVQRLPYISRIIQTLTKVKAGGRAVSGREQEEESVWMLFNYCHLVTFPLIAL